MTDMERCREAGIREAIAALEKARVRGSEKHVLWDVRVAIHALLKKAPTRLAAEEGDARDGE